MAPLLSRSHEYPLSNLKQWNPFRLDALGLVTLLGADEVARAVGSLTRNSLTDYLPVFGAFKVASDQIATVEPGFALYNITDGIWVTELRPFFTRWLAMNLENKYTVLSMTVEEKARRFPWRSLLAIAVGLIINLGLLALACVQADWYGIANSCSMIVSVVLRSAVCSEYRDRIDVWGKRFWAPSPPGKEPKTTKKKVLVVLPDGKLVIGNIPVGLIPVLLDVTPPPPDWKLFPAAVRALLMGRESVESGLANDRQHQQTRIDQSVNEKQGSSKLQTSETKKPTPIPLGPYVTKLKIWFLRAAGWLAFGVQIVAIGQATLVTQICTVAVMTIASVATIYNVGAIERWQVGEWLNFHQRPVPAFQGKVGGRNEAYAMLEPSVTSLVTDATNTQNDSSEEDWMRARGLLPDQRNKKWYAEVWEPARRAWAQEKLVGEGREVCQHLDITSVTSDVA